MRASLPTVSFLSSSPGVSRRFSTVCQSGFYDDNEHHFSRKSLKYWDKFYQRHKSKFFRDRHYLEKDWGKYFLEDNDGGAGGGRGVSANGRVLLEVGCGAGNTIFPLIAAYPKLFVYACDFSSDALALVKSHSEFKEDRIHLFNCDVSSDELCDKILPCSVDVVTLVFMLSAVSPNKMSFVLQNLKKVLKPDGHILVRDYAVGDSAQVKLENRNQIISHNYYFRLDGTALDTCNIQKLLTASFFFFLCFVWSEFDIMLACEWMEDKSTLGMSQQLRHAQFPTGNPKLVFADASHLDYVYFRDFKMNQPPARSLSRSSSGNITESNAGRSLLLNSLHFKANSANDKASFIGQSFTVGSSILSNFPVSIALST